MFYSQSASTVIIIRVKIRRSSVRSRECLTCIEVFAGSGASGEIETDEWCGQFYVFFQYDADQDRTLISAEQFDRSAVGFEPMTF